MELIAGSLPFPSLAATSPPPPTAAGAVTVIGLAQGPVPTWHLDEVLDWSSLGAPVTAASYRSPRATGQSRHEASIGGLSASRQ